RIQGRTSNTVVVLGVADIYLAGMPAGFTFGSSSAPLNSPVEAGLAVVAGRSIQISATGTVGGDGPNGVTSGFAVGQLLCSGAPNGISRLGGPRHSLIGVFLGPDQPTTP